MMKIFEGSTNYNESSRHKTIVAIGNFDGVHLGHLKLLQLAKEMAKRKNSRLLAYTFFPHPAALLAPQLAPLLLQTIEQRKRSLEEAGVDICIIEPFDHALSGVSPDYFFHETLLNRLHASGIVIGYDFTFGKNRSGNTAMLQSLAQKEKIELIVTPPQLIDEILISSTNIRQALRGGQIDLANKLLGRAYEITGLIIPGRGFGKEIGARTANLKPYSQIIPSDGVYLTETTIDKTYPSITSIGNNPTFSFKQHSIETHLLDTERDLQGVQVSINFLHRMRDQKAFNSVEELTHQISDDLKEARKMHEKRKGI
ncbi:MAG: bifunctional riboflavin kinase/FAD synthetase [Pseudomonadota bacterium]